MIGEATKHVPDDFRVATDDIPWRAISGMRDIVVHRYFGVQDDYVWDVATTQIPPLLKRLEEELAQLHQAD